MFCTAAYNNELARSAYQQLIDAPQFRVVCVGMAGNISLVGGIKWV